MSEHLCSINLNLVEFTNLTELNVAYNNYFSKIMQIIVSKSPNISKLNISGQLYSQNLNLSSLTKLRKLVMSYYDDFTKVLKTVNSTNLKKVDVYNSVTKANKNNKVINFENLKQLFLSLNECEFKFVECKYTVPGWMRQNQNGIFVIATKKEVIVKILK